jgi:hypothetical protein
MKKLYLGLTCIGLMIGSCEVFGQVMPVDTDTEKNSSGEVTGGNVDYQQQILSNPETNQAARVGVGSNTGESGDNTAVINQNGSSNSASIIQSGDNNKAEQYQKGKNNLLYLKQKGKNNYHKETQDGNNNRKIIIQNDSETFIQQITP